MSATEPPNEAELRAAYEAQMKQIRVEDLLLETVVSMINFGMRRTGLAPGTESERDAQQVRLAIESVRALMPLVDQVAPDQVSQIRQALSQLQLAFVRIGGGAAAGEHAAPAPGGVTPAAGGAAAGAGGAAAGAGGAAGGRGGGAGAGGRAPGGGAGDGSGAVDSSEEPIKPGEPGPAQRSGRLWVPGSR